MSLHNQTPFEDISQKEFDKLPKHIKRHLRGYNMLRRNLKDLFPLNNDNEDTFIDDLKLVSTSCLSFVCMEHELVDNYQNPVKTDALDFNLRYANFVDFYQDYLKRNP